MARAGHVGSMRKSSALMIDSLFRSACISALVAMAAPAVAQDARISTHGYNADEIVKLEGKLNVQTTISFGANERIENVAVGDPDSWQIVPNKRADLLFVKPLVATARTNMTVVTDRHTYFFDLVASPTAKPFYALRFTYVQPAIVEAPPPAVAAAPVVAPAPLAVATPPPSPPAETPLPPASQGPAPATTTAAADPAQPAWRTSGSRKLLPATLYDDGKSTFLQWPEGVPVPSLFARDSSGKETPLAYTVQGEGIVVDGVPAQIVLRDRRARAWLERVSDAPVVRATGLTALPEPVAPEQPASE